MKKNEEFLKHLDRQREVKIEPDVKNEINAIIDNETNEKDLEAKAKELLKVSIPLLHKKLKDQGFVGIPTYMFEVLLKAGLTFTEFRLFLYIFKMTFGMNGAKRKYYEPKEKRYVKLGKNTNRLYLNQMADAIGIDYSIIHRYIKKLKDKSMISCSIKLPKSWVILVNMNWNQWNISEDVRINQLVKILKTGKLT